MAVVYEWSIELTAEDGDIEETLHGGTIDEVVGYADRGDPALKRVLVLVRDTGNDVDGNTDRMWAYVDKGMLPAEFTYCGGTGPNGIKVPQKFHRQIAAWTARNGIFD